MPYATNQSYFLSIVYGTLTAPAPAPAFALVRLSFLQLLVLQHTPLLISSLPVTIVYKMFSLLHCAGQGFAFLYKYMSINLLFQATERSVSCGVLSPHGTERPPPWTWWLVLAGR